MLLELQLLLCTFENSTKRCKISVDSDAFRVLFRIAKRSVSKRCLENSRTK